MDGVRLRPDGPNVDGSVKVNDGEADGANVLNARGSNDNDNKHVFESYLELLGGKRSKIRSVGKSEDNEVKKLLRNKKRGESRKRLKPSGSHALKEKCLSAEAGVKGVITHHPFLPASVPCEEEEWEEGPPTFTIGWEENLHHLPIMNEHWCVEDEAELNGDVDLEVLAGESVGMSGDVM